MCLRKSDRSAVAQDHKGRGHPSSPAISPFLLVTITWIIKSTEHKIYFSDNFYRWYHFSSCLMYTLQIIFIYDISFFLSLCVCVCMWMCTRVWVWVYTPLCWGQRRTQDPASSLYGCLVPYSRMPQWTWSSAELQHIPGIPVSLLCTVLGYRYTQQCTGSHVSFVDLNLGPYSCTLHAFPTEPFVRPFFFFFFVFLV